MEPRSGIYQITNLLDGKIYVGSSVDIPSRWVKHRYALQTQTHRNIHLQRAWDKYGSSSFDWVVLEECDEESLLELEQWYMDTTNCYGKDGYNISKFAGRPSWEDESVEKVRASLQGVKAPRAKLSAEEVEELRLRYRDEVISQRDLGEQYGISAGAVNGIVAGRSYPKCRGPLLRRDQRLDRMSGSGSRNGNAKLSEEHVLEIRRLSGLGVPRREIAQLFSVSRENVSAIVQRRTWKHV